MKRAAISFSLLALLLYNAFGYYLLFAYEQQCSSLSAISQLSDSDFIITKIPATLYIHVEDSDFEMVNTEVKVNDKVFNVIKQRILHDTLFMYSLRNFKSEDLNYKLNEMIVAQTLQKQTSEHTSPIKNLLKSFIKEYIEHASFCLKSHQFALENNLQISGTHNETLKSIHVSVPAPPPKFI